MDIFALFHSFCLVYSATMLRFLSDIIAGALCAPHHITMRNTACWSTYNYRTVQRSFDTPSHCRRCILPSLHTAIVTTHLHEKHQTLSAIFLRSIVCRRPMMGRPKYNYFNSPHGSKQVHNC